MPSRPKFHVDTENIAVIVNCDLLALAINIVNKPHHTFQRYSL